MKRWMWIATLFLLAACAPASTVLAPPSFDARAVELVRLDPPGVGSEALVVGIDLVVGNPNPVNLSLRDVELALQLDGSSVASSSLPAGLGLPANGAAEVRVEVAVPWSGAPSLVGSLGGFVTGTPLDYRIEAAVTVDVFGVPQRFGDVPVAQGRLEPPSGGFLPTVRLDPAGAQLALSVTTLSVEIGVLFENPGPIGTTVRTPGLDLRLDGRSLGSIGVAPTAIPANETVRVPVRLDVGLAEVGATLASRLATGRVGDVEIALSGDWTFDVAGTTLGRRGGWLGLGGVR